MKLKDFANRIDWRAMRSEDGQLEALRRFRDASIRLGTTYAAWCKAKQKFEGGFTSQAISEGLPTLREDSDAERDLCRQVRDLGNEVFKRGAVVLRGNDLQMPRKRELRAIAKTADWANWGDQTGGNGAILRTDIRFNTPGLKWFVAVRLALAARHVKHTEGTWRAAWDQLTRLPLGGGGLKH